MPRRPGATTSHLAKFAMMSNLFSSETNVEHDLEEAAEETTKGAKYIYNPIYSESKDFKTNFGRSSISEPRAEEATVEVSVQKESQEIRRSETTINSFSDYTLNTTFHGIRYIFHNDGITIRRLCWIVMVFTSIGLFVYQVGDRGRTYFQYHSNVNVEVVFAEDVLFPSVTFCNQNNFRLTASVDEDMYEFLDYVYNQGSLHGLDVSNFTIKHGNLDDIYQNLGHQLRDFVHRWRGSDCDFEKDFVTTMTDFGVCYTFNHKEVSNVLKVTQSGAGYALRLVLNIEEYEYMKGPHGEAGIKILLHDPRETPLVGDLGFAVAPGTHTLIGVNREEIDSLPYPYGTCVKEAVPRSACEVKCRAKDSLKYCGCVDAYMPLPENASYCPIEEASICLRHAKENSSLSPAVCECDVPCERVAYHPELSYAHLSQLNIHKIWQEAPQKRARVLEDYIQAREVTHRVDKAIAEQDKINFMEIINTWETLQTQLSDSTLSLNDATYLKATLNVTKPPTFIHDSVAATFSLLKSEYDTRGEMLSKTPPTMTMTNQYIAVLNRFLYVYENQPGGYTRYILQHCSEIELYNVSSVDISYMSPLFSLCDDDDYRAFLGWIKKHIVTDDPTVYFSYFSLRDGYNFTVLEIQTMKDNYAEDVQFIYGNTTRYREIIGSQEHVQCGVEIEAATDSYLETFSPLLKLYDEYLNASTFTEKLATANTIFDVYNLSTQFLAKDTMKSCEWIQQTDYDKDTSWVKFTDYSTQILDTLFEAQTISSILQASKEYKTLLKELEKTVVMPFSSYLSGDVSKTHLHELISSDEYDDALNLLSSKHNTYQSLLTLHIQTLNSIQLGLKSTMSYTYNLTIPLMVYDVLKKLPLLDDLKSTYSSVEFLTQSIRDFPSASLDSLPVFEDIVDTLFDNYIGQLSGAKTDLHTTYKNLQKTLGENEQDLRTFITGNKLDEIFFLANYIKIDVFYKELSYTKVKQQKAFEFISFLSEIGGFLGLLLGASVLTVCELLDHVSLMIMKRLTAVRN